MSRARCDCFELHGVHVRGGEEYISEVRKLVVLR